MLVEGVHFLPDVDPGALGHKALAVNLSDLAACGAKPCCFFLALGLPRVDEAWLAAFSDGLLQLADRHRCALAGGDTTRSPAGVTIAITALGKVARDRVVARSGAREGDDLWVSGALGDAALGLAVRRGEIALPEGQAQAAIQRLERPEPRVVLGRSLAGIVSAMIDVSDGLLGDLGHLAAASRVSAVVEWDAVPRSAAVRTLADAAQQRLALTGGDDYELAFAAPPQSAPAVTAAAAAAAVTVTRIGRVGPGDQVRIVDRHGEAMDIPGRPFDHFRA
jgi:thiamine-monophosphate kinase